jgi:hypothetical protein
MAKYMILYNSSAQAADLMANASSEQMKASMDEWISWRNEASSRVKVEFGLPLQPVSHVTPSGVAPSNSKTSGYSIMESEDKDVIMDLLKIHPHLKRDGASIDVLEMLLMPGMAAASTDK